MGRAKTLNMQNLAPEYTQIFQCSQSMNSAVQLDYALTAEFKMKLDTAEAVINAVKQNLTK